MTALSAVPTLPGSGFPERVDGSGLTAVVTGGAGFIGGHLASYLARRQFRVVLLDEREPAAAMRSDRRIESVRVDVTDVGRCVEALRDVAPQVVFHLAATATIDSAFGDPHRSLSTNVGGTINVLEAARVACPGLVRFVQASTDKVYGELVGDAYVEGSPLCARGVYDVGKLAADTIVSLYGAELGLPVSTLRLCNVFGPGDRNTGSRIVPRSLSRLFHPDGPLPPLVYEGSLGHGRDYVYVGDVLRALVAVAFTGAARGEVFNMLPAAHRTTLGLVEELVERAARVCEPVDRHRARTIRRNGYEVVRGSGAARALDRQHCDGSKLSSVVGFRNAVTMADGLDATIATYLDKRRAA